MIYPSGFYAILRNDKTFKEATTFLAPFNAKAGSAIPITDGFIPTVNESTHKLTLSGYEINVQSNYALRHFKLEPLSADELKVVAFTAEFSSISGFLPSLKTQTLPPKDVQAVVAYLLGIEVDSNGRSRK